MGAAWQEKYLPQSFCGKPNLEAGAFVVIGSRVAAILILLVLTLLVMHKKLKGEETELGDKIGVYT